MPRMHMRMHMRMQCKAMHILVMREAELLCMGTTLVRERTKMIHTVAPVTQRAKKTEKRHNGQAHREAC